MRNLTERQMKFIDAYIKCGNGAAAAIKAGYSENSARITASKLLTKANIREYMKERRSQIQQDLREQFISDALVARKVMLKILNDPEASDKDKLTAARDLMDRAGFKPTGRSEITGRDSGAIEIVFVAE
jgi:phage terminase small subunit